MRGAAAKAAPTHARRDSTRPHRSRADGGAHLGRERRRLGERRALRRRLERERLLLQHGGVARLRHHVGAQRLQLGLLLRRLQVGRLLREPRRLRRLLRLRRLPRRALRRARVAPLLEAVDLGERLRRLRGDECRLGEDARRLGDERALPLLLELLLAAVLLLDGGSGSGGGGVRDRGRCTDRRAGRCTDRRVGGRGSCGRCGAPPPP